MKIEEKFSYNTKDDLAWQQSTIVKNIFAE